MRHPLIRFNHLLCELGSRQVSPADEKNQLAAPARWRAIKTTCLFFTNLIHSINQSWVALLRDGLQRRSLPPYHCSKWIKDWGLGNLIYMEGIVVHLKSPALVVALAAVVRTYLKV